LIFLKFLYSKIKINTVKVLWLVIILLLTLNTVSWYYIFAHRNYIFITCEEKASMEYQDLLKPYLSKDLQ